MADARTLDVYASKARDYADRFVSDKPDRHLAAFISALPQAARVLDLGCGPGQSAATMQAAGLGVDAWDGSPEMAALAHEKFDVAVRVATFDELNVTETYDGIFANFSLLHTRKSDMPGNLARIARALKPRGLFHIGLKTGTGENRDALGRFYAYYEDAEITRLLQDAGFDILTRDFGADAGLDGTLAPWIIMKARKK